MESLTGLTGLELICWLTKRWGIYVELIESDLEALQAAAPWLDITQHQQLITDGWGYLLFPSEEEARTIYEQTVGEDGPTAQNAYDGGPGVLAILVGPDGWITENT